MGNETRLKSGFYWKGLPASEGSSGEKRKEIGSIRGKAVYWWGIFHEWRRGTFSINV